MQVKVTFRNSDSRDEIKKHAEEKIEKIKFAEVPKKFQMKKNILTSWLKTTTDF